MRLRCYFDAITDQCVGFVTLEAGQINSKMPYMYKAEAIPFKDPRYSVNKIDWLDSIPREMNLNVFPNGMDLGELLFLEEQSHVS